MRAITLREIALFKSCPHQCACVRHINGPRVFDHIIHDHKVQIKYEFLLNMKAFAHAYSTLCTCACVVHIMAL